MIPTLPQNDASPANRRAHIEHARATYEYGYDWPPGIAVTKELPKSEEFSKLYELKAAAIEALVLANHALSEVERWLPFGFATVSRAARAPTRLAAPLVRTGKFNVFGNIAALSAKAPPKRIETVDDFEQLFGLIRKGPLIEAYNQGEHAQNVAFGWQRTAGANPMVLKRMCDKPGKDFWLDDARFAAIMGKGETLAGAFAEHRLFIADYAPLDGITCGTWNRGRNLKYMWGPTALFAWRRSRGEVTGYLVPVAIKVRQAPDAPVFTPADDWRWTMARTMVQIADGNDHEAIQHLGRTHLVMEAMCLAAHRNLAPNHPLLVLLEPHFEFTLAINDHAAHNLIAPGGTLDVLFGGTIEATLKLVKTGLQDFKLKLAAPDDNIADRGLATNDCELPVYPYRDDARWVYKAIVAFADKYVSLYYANDKAVQLDDELRDMLEEVRAPDGAKLRRAYEVHTVEDLSGLVARLIWTGSAQHGALNFAQFPYMGLIPNMPGAGYAPAPDHATPNTQIRFLEMLPPISAAWAHFDMAYLLSNVRANKLGAYPTGHFKDPRVKPLVDDLNANLKVAEDIIHAQNEGRIMTYPYLLPSGIPASIHI